MRNILSIHCHHDHGYVSFPPDNISPPIRGKKYSGSAVFDWTDYTMYCSRVLVVFTPAVPGLITRVI